MKIKKLRTSIFLSTSLLAASCGAFDSSRIAPGYMDSYKVIKNYIYGNKERGVSPEVIEGIPYASMLLRIGRGAEGLLILEGKNKSGETWVSADKVFIKIKNGKIIQTTGLQNNLSNITFNTYQSNGYLRESVNKEFNLYYSYDEPELKNLSLKVKVEEKGIYSVELLSSTKDLTLVEEYIESEYLGWKITNQYWIDNENFVWKSKQFLSPLLPAIYIEVTKKPT